MRDECRIKICMKGRKAIYVQATYNEKAGPSLGDVQLDHVLARPSGGRWAMARNNFLC